MKTTCLAALAAALLIGSAGCVNVRPVGPMTRVMGTKPILGSERKAPPAKPKEGEVDAAVLGPVPPAATVSPEDVSPDDPERAARLLQGEFEADRKTMPAPSATAEVSVIKNGVKVQ